MKRRWRLLVVGLFVLAGIGLLILDPRDGWLHGEARRTAELVEQALQERGRSEVFEAVLRIGAPAVPLIARDDLDLRAAAVAYSIAGQTNLRVETCVRLAERNPDDLVWSQELSWFRDVPEWNQHFIPGLERLHADSAVTAERREAIIGRLESRGSDAGATLNRLRGYQTQHAHPSN